MKRTVIITLILSLLLMPLSVPAAAVSDAGSGYSDISGGWYADAAAKFGYPDIFSDGGRFHPEAKITRIEFVRLLHKALGISINYFAPPRDISNDFSDMKNSDIGASELLDLTAAGIIESGGRFSPGGQLDRDLMIHWVMNALKYETGGNYSIPKRLVEPFKDDKGIGEAYQSDVYTAQLLGFIFGRDNHLFFPKDGATRAEAVTIVMRLTAFLDSVRPHVAVTPFAWIAEDGTLTLSLTILNGTDKTVTIHHKNGQRYDFKLFDKTGSTIYTWSIGKLFTAVTSDTVINPGESIVFSDALDVSAFNAGQVPAAMTAYIVGTSSDFTIDENGYASSIIK